MGYGHDLPFTQVQRSAAGVLRTLAFKNEANKDQIVQCNALPMLILMLESEDTLIHYEAVGVVGNLVHSSRHIEQQVSADFDGRLLRDKWNITMLSLNSRPPK